MSNQGEKSFKKAYIFVLTAGCLWGTMGLFSGTLSGMGLESLNISFFRMCAAAVIMFMFILFKDGVKAFSIDMKGIGICIILGVFCQGLFNYSYNESLRSVGIVSAAVLLYTAPIFVTIMSRIFFKERITGQKVLALLINIVGCTLTVSGGDFSSMNFSLYGATIGTLAGFLYGLMTVVSSLTTERYSPRLIIFYSFVFGAIFLALMSNPMGAIQGHSSNPIFWLLFFGYGLIPTVGSYLAYMKGLSYNPPTSKVPVIASVETIVAAFVGIFAFGETMGIVKALGIALVIGSIAIMNGNFNRKQEK